MDKSHSSISLEKAGEVIEVIEVIPTALSVEK
jgi:hypothetical protein